MAIEGKMNAVDPRPFTADATAQGVITVADTAGFRTKQVAYLKGTALPDLLVQVKKVLSPTKLIVGRVDQKIASWMPLDTSAYTVAAASVIGAEEQNKNNIPQDDHYRAVYESDPVVADRVVFVDKYGNFFDNDNPLPIIFDGTISVGQVEVVGTNGNTIEPNPDGSINVVIESIPSSNVSTVSKFNEIVAVPSGSTTQLVTYTVPAGKSAVLQKAVVSGDNIGKYDLLINNIRQDTIRTMFGADLSITFDFTSGNENGLVLVAGDIVKVQVFNPRPYSADYNARIQVLEVIL